MATKSLSQNVNQVISDLNGIKQAIEEKGVLIPAGTPTARYREKILEISPNLQEKTLEINGRFLPDEGYDGFSAITVNCPDAPSQDKNVSYTENGTYTVCPDEGYTMREVSVNVNVPSRELNLQDKSVSINGIYTADVGFDALNSVTVMVPEQQEQSKDIIYTSNGNYTVTPDNGFLLNQVGISVQVEPVLQNKTTTVNGNITADDGYDGLDTVTVNVPTLDTSDATAANYDISHGKTAYVNGQKITGTRTTELDGSATPEKVLDGYTFYSTDSDVQQVGNIISLESREYTPSVGNQIIPAGKYLAGRQLILGDANLIADNIKKDVSIFGVTGTVEIKKEEQIKSCDPTINTQEVLPDEGKVLSKVNIGAIQTEEKTTMVNGEVVPTAGKFLSKVIVNVATGTSGLPIEVETAAEMDSLLTIEHWGYYYQYIGNTTSDYVSRGIYEVVPDSMGGYKFKYLVDPSGIETVASMVLGDTSFMNNKGEYIQGGMANNHSASLNINSLVALPCPINEGYYDGQGYIDITADERAKIVSENIRKDISILGVTGSYEGESVNLQSKTVLENGTITPDEGYDGLSSVVVNVQETHVTPVSSVETPWVTAEWSKTEEGVYETVTLPHTCNVADAQSRSFYRGNTFYKKTLTLSAEDLESNWYVKLEQSTMSSYIYVNNTQIYYHPSGYSPCTVKLTNLIQGDNIIKVKCNNTNNVNVPPISADFSFPNGLIGLAYFIKTKNVYIDPIEFGIDRVHISQRKITSSNAEYGVDFLIDNDVNVVAKTRVDISLIDSTNNVVQSSSEYVLIPSNGHMYYSKIYNYSNPHLWNGRADPYLYTLKINLLIDDAIIDNREIPVGFRSISATHTAGMSLNGNKIVLWGAAVHQDTAHHGAALTHEDYDNNFTFYNDIGCNYLRLAHYPHNIYEYKLADRYGYLTEVEMPWVNNCPSDASQDFKDALFIYLKDMINNMYNHPCVAMWGTSNELGGNHQPVSGLNYDENLAKELNNELFRYGRQLDPYRMIGCQTTAASIDAGFLGDWMAFNTYDAWYISGTNQQTSVYNSLHNNQCRYVDGISEYGAGANVNQQSENWMTEENRGSSGANHFESYQSYVHEFQIQKIKPLTTTLGIVSMWAFFDFAAWPRSEGGSSGLNDKGLVTRDRSIRKDSYYLYKAFWNKLNNTSLDKIVYIKDRRLSQRTTDTITITAYSNCDKVELYQNDVLMQTMISPTDSISEVIWTFNAIDFYNRTDTITVKGYVGDEEDPVSTDTTTFTTSGGHIGSDPFVNLNMSNISCSKQNTPDKQVTLTANSDWEAINIPEWVTVTPSSGVLGENLQVVVPITISIADNTTDQDRNATITFKPITQLVTYTSDTLEITQSGTEDIIKYLDEVSKGVSAAYVDTGYSPVETTRIEAKLGVPLTIGTSQQIFGVQSGTKADRIAFYLKDTSATATSVNSMYSTSDINNPTIASPQDRIFTISIDKNTSIINDVSYNITSPADISTSGYNLYILNRNNSGSPETNGAVADTKIYYFRIYEGDVLIKNYVPALDENDIPALYETVGRQFYYLNGSYVFNTDTNIVVNNDNLTLSGTASSNVINVITENNSSLEVYSKPEWITSAVFSGVNNNILTITYNDNLTSDSLTGQLIIKNVVTTKTINLTQPMAVYTLSVSPISASVNNDAGSEEIAITSNAYERVLIDDTVVYPDWITPTLNNDKTVLTLAYTANDTGIVRTGTVGVKLNIGDHTAIVNLSQSADLNSIELNPTSQSVSASAGTLTVSINASDYDAVSLGTYSEWITPVLSADKHSVELQYSENGAEARMGIVNIVCGDVSASTTINQGAILTYTPVEYLTSPADSGAYINTGINVDTNWKMEFKGYTSGVNGTALWGARTATNSKRFDFLVDQYGKYLLTVYKDANNLLAYESAEVASTTLPEEFVYNADLSSKTITSNDFTFGPGQAGIVGKGDPSFTTSYPLFLMADNTAGTAKNTNFDRTLCFMRIYDTNNILIHNYIPVLDTSNVVCIYDTVTEQYLYNAGTGTFTAGPIVQ